MLSVIRYDHLHPPQCMLLGLGVIFNTKFCAWFYWGIPWTKQIRQNQSNLSSGDMTWHPFMKSTYSSSALDHPSFAYSGSSVLTGKALMNCGDFRLDWSRIYSWFLSSSSGIFTCFHIPLSFKNFSLWPVVKLWGIFIRLSKNKFLMSQTLWCNIAHWNEKEEKPVGTGFRRVDVPIPYLFFARLISSVRPFLPYLLMLLTCPYMGTSITAIVVLDRPSPHNNREPDLE